MRAMCSLALRIALGLAFVACQRDRTTHTKSDSLPALATRQDFLERYVTFRRNYTTLDFDVKYVGDSGALGPNTTGCDIRIHATVPPNELADWRTNLAAWAGPVNPTWIQTIPNAPTNLDDFEWWQGNDTRDLHEVAISKKTSEVLYWHVCSRN